jgi:hypothetical protein
MNLATGLDAWEWDVLSLATAVAVAIVPKMWRSYRSRASETWPISYGRILSVSINVQERRTELKAAYSYRVGDQSYGGTFKEAFADGDEAEAWEKALPGQQVPVHYDSNRPSRSRLTESDLQTIAQAFAPPVPAQTGEIGELAWRERLLCQLGFLVALAGFAASLAELVSENMGKPPLGHGAHSLLSLGAFAVMFFSLWEGRRGGKRSWRTLPGWMKYLGYVVLLYTIFSALPFLAHRSGRDQRIRHTTPDVSYQLAMYFGAVELLYARLKSDTKQEDYLQRSLNGQAKIG